jgi:ribonuclease III
MLTNVQQLEQLLDYTFNDQRLLIQALTHPSHLHEAGGVCGDYQRLEFLGDAVLGLLLADLLFERYPDWDEGDLSQLRSRLAGQDVLADRARRLGVGGCIKLGRGERQTNGCEKDSILADVLEALLAALYRDAGLEAARALVVRLFDELAAEPQKIVLGRDSKSELQEYLSSHARSVPEYRLIEESGPPHDRLFVFQILVDDCVVSCGQGKSKKIAQQAAAAAALSALQSGKGQQN